MFSLSWVIGSGEQAKGGNEDNIHIDQVISILDLIFDQSGSLTLDLIDAPATGPQNLSVEFENGLSVLSLGEEDDDDYFVRTYTSNLNESKKVIILGNEWDARLVCDDKEIVKKIFIEFFSTKNVSKKLLS